MHLVAVGGSDAGIAAALRARELDPAVDVSVVVADRYPNFSICGIPYYVSGDVRDWRTLAHRSIADLQTAGLRLLLDTTANSVDVDARRLSVVNPGGRESRLPYDELVIATGATPVRPPIGGLDGLGSDHGVFLLHTMGDTFALTEFIDTHHPATAIIVGAGYLGLEMAEALTTRGMRVTEVEKNTPNVAHDNPTDQRLHASLILGFADTPARAAFFDSEEITTPSDRLSVFASAVHAYEMSEALTYVKEGKILPHYQT